MYTIGGQRTEPQKKIDKQFYVHLPVDRNGQPINVDDTVYWTDDDGNITDTLTIAYMTYYGDVNGEPIWTAQGSSGREDDFSDNLEGSYLMPKKSVDDIISEMSDALGLADQEEMRDKILQLAPQLMNQYKEEYHNGEWW